MPKISALTTLVSVTDSGAVARDISSDVRSIDFEITREDDDITGLDKTAMERLLLRSDGRFSLTGKFNTTANKSHDVFKTVGTQAGTVLRTVIVGFSGGGTIIGDCVPLSYNLSVAENGSLGWTADLAWAGGTAAAWS